MKKLFIILFFILPYLCSAQILSYGKKFVFCNKQAVILTQSSGNMTQLPTNTLTATATSSSTIHLSWNADANAVNYHLYSKPGASQTWAVDGSWTYFGGDITGTSHDTTGLSPGTTLSFAEFDRNTGVYTTSLPALASATTTSSGSTLSLNNSTLSESSSSGTDAISVTSNISWTATSSQSWLTITSGSSGTNNGTINLSYTSNSGSSRSATITVSGSGVTSQVCTVTQLGTVSNLYVFSWNGISTGGYNGTGQFQDGVWSSGTDTYTDPEEPTTQGSPALTYGGTDPRWTSNTGVSGNTVVTDAIQRTTGERSIHFILNPFTPTPPSGIYDSGISGQPASNCRTELMLNNGTGGFSPWIPIGSEVWSSWSIYVPYLSSVLDASYYAIDLNYVYGGPSETVLRQWSPIGSEDGPQIDLRTVANGGDHGYGIGNWLGYQNQVTGGSYVPGDLTVTNANEDIVMSGNYGHIVPGVWMDFVEHIIIDDGTGASAGKGCYQLWCSIPTTGLPSNQSYRDLNYNTTCTVDLRYQNYGGLYLWYSFNGIHTTRNHTTDSSGVSTQGAGVWKVGIYNGGEGWHRTSPIPADSSQGWMVRAMSNNGGGQPGPASNAQMEYYMSQIKIEFLPSGTINYGPLTNSPSILNAGGMYDQNGANTSTYYIDANGYNNVKR